MKLLPLTFCAALAVAFAPFAHAADAPAAVHNSAFTTIERLALLPASPFQRLSSSEPAAISPNTPQPPSRSFFHLATTSSCNAAQTQCVAACSTKSGQVAQNCVSDCHDIRSVCQ